MTRRSWHWEWLPDQGSGSEQFECGAGPAGYLLRGEIAATLEGAPLKARYEVETDAAWATRRVWIEVVGPHRAIELHANGAGRWSGAEGIWIPALDGCIDIDISLTPATNTLPIRRLGLNVGEGAEIKVAYILAPDMTLRAGSQRYTRVADRLWRFDGIDIDFTAEIAVDAEGFVIEYPGLFHRTA